MYKKLLFGITISAVAAFAIAKSSVVFFNTKIQDPTIDIQNITLSNNPSASFNVITPVVETKQEVVNDTINEWRLSATILGESPIAMLAKGNTPTVLKINEKLDGYNLEAIEKNRVKFVSGAKTVWLSLDAAQTTPPPQAAAPTTTDGDVLNKSVSQDYFQKNLSQPAQLLQDINILPIMNGENFEGFKVAYLRKRSFLNVIGGLEENDIITEFNGEKLKSIADGIGIYQKAMGLKNFTLKVNRGGAEKTIRYNIN